MSAQGHASGEPAGAGRGRGAGGGVSQLRCTSFGFGELSKLFYSLSQVNQRRRLQDAGPGPCVFVFQKMKRLFAVGTDKNVPEQHLRGKQGARSRTGGCRQYSSLAPWEWTVVLAYLRGAIFNIVCVYRLRAHHAQLDQAIEQLTSGVVLFCERIHPESKQAHRHRWDRVRMGTDMSGQRTHTHRSREDGMGLLNSLQEAGGGLAAERERRGSGHGQTRQ